MSERYDIVIIGGGNAGFGVSQIAHAAGKSIAFVESDEFGGTCPNRGCTPKKVLVAAAHAMHEIEIAHHHGIEVGPAKLDWAALIDRKSDMIDFIPGAMENLAKDGELSVYMHDGFWHPMDTLRDKRYLESLWEDKKAPWKTWQD